jgi:DNA/RNA endonuclease YhcR with UshA esterase domain
VIWGSNRINFQNQPEDYYNAKNVCITGVTVIYNGKPEIIINKESEIEIK